MECNTDNLGIDDGSVVIKLDSGKTINTDDYTELECRYCNARVMSAPCEIPKLVQVGAKDLGLIEAVLVYGCCPVCLTVVTGLCTDHPVVYLKQYADAYRMLVAKAGIPLQLLSDSTGFERIRAGITDTTMWVFDHDHRIQRLIGTYGSVAVGEQYEL